MKRPQHRFPSILSLTDLAFILLLIFSIQMGLVGEKESKFVVHQLPVSADQHAVRIILTRKTISIKHPSLSERPIKYNNEEFDFTEDCKIKCGQILKRLNKNFGTLNITLEIGKDTEYWAVIRLKEFLKPE